jgi:hypothetical protein
LNHPSLEVVRGSQRASDHTSQLKTLGGVSAGCSARRPLPPRGPQAPVFIGAWGGWAYRGVRFCLVSTRMRKNLVGEYLHLGPYPEKLCAADRA